MKKILENPQLRQMFAVDCAQVVVLQVQSQKGFSGFAVKKSYQALNKLKPNAAERAAHALLEDFAGQIEPYLKEFTRQKVDAAELKSFLKEKTGPISKDFLKLIDSKAKQLDSMAFTTFYAALRPNASKHIEKSVPELAEIIHKYLVTSTRNEPMSAT